MLKALYDWTMRMAGHRRAMPALFGVSFIESSFFPIPPDVMVVPMVLADKTKAFRIALVCTLGSVLGALLGYAIGALLYEAAARPLIEFYGYGEAFRDFTRRYNEWGAWIVAGAALTPFPYKVITIASGAVGLDIWVFVIASILARGLRFYVEAALLWRYGPPIRAFIEGNLKFVTTAFFCLLIGGFVVIKYLV
ncbi:MAG TPA: YqaA family protein [Alphaproteobacteria bacterium]|nr:YqaA family protein [Alphaproteobacteria bacterium]